MGRLGERSVSTTKTVMKKIVMRHFIMDIMDEYKKKHRNTYGHKMVSRRRNMGYLMYYGMREEL